MNKKCQKSNVPVVGKITFNNASSTDTLLLLERNMEQFAQDANCLVKLCFERAIPSLNQLNGKWAKSNWKKWYLRRLRGVEPLEKTRKRITVVSCSRKKRDWDNERGGLKPLLDALKINGGVGLIVDDDDKWLEHGDHKFITGPIPWTIVIIEEMK